MTKHSPADAKRKRRHARAWTALGLGSLLWFLLRTGSKPQRAAYPCQQAALASGLGFLSYLAALAGVEGLRRLLRRRVGAAAAAAIAALLLALVSIGHPGGATPARAAATGLPGWTSATAVSNVFAVESVPPAECSLDGGVIPCDPALQRPGVRLQGQGRRAPGAADGGARDLPAHDRRASGRADRSERRRRGQGQQPVGRRRQRSPGYGRLATSSDVLKGVIWRILQHPDGFSGEVVVAENTQGANRNWDNNPANAQDQDQSYQDVVAAFQAHGYPVSFAAWDDLPLLAGGSVDAAGYPTGEYANGNSVRRLHPAGRSGSRRDEPVLVPQVPDDRRPIRQHALRPLERRDLRARAREARQPARAQEALHGGVDDRLEELHRLRHDRASNDSPLRRLERDARFLLGLHRRLRPQLRAGRARDGPHPQARPEHRRRDLGRDGGQLRRAPSSARTRSWRARDPFAVDWYASEYVLRPVAPRGR